MNKREEKDLYTIKDDNIIVLIMIIFLILASLSLIANYIFSILIKNPNLTDNQYNLFFLFQQISFILIIVFSIINAIVLFILIKSSQETDYNKYKDYVIISKSELKEYKGIIAKYEKEIKYLRNIK